MTNLKKMTPREFRELGYLQEVNRRFLHPLGLALEVVVDDDGTEHFGGVWDYRDDPEGIVFDPDVIDTEKADRIKEEWYAKMASRQVSLGHMIQPTGDK